MTTARVAVAGATGFVGRAVVDALALEGIDVVRLPSFRLTEPGSGYVGGSPSSGLDVVTGQLAEEVDGSSVLINCAGWAEPGSADEAGLELANAATVGLLQMVAHRSGCERFVHVSSAAVQGRRRVLDESPAVEPLTPYARSKAAGEEMALQGSRGSRCETVIYRATSVQGSTRDTTASLRRVLDAPILPVVEDGRRRIPLSHIDNCAAAIVHLATTTSALGPVVLQPWEGMTVGAMLAAAGADARRIPTPGWAAEALITTARVVARSPGLAARVRQAELFLVGQEQRAAALAEDGFVLPRTVGDFTEFLRASSRG